MKDINTYIFEYNTPDRIEFEILPDLEIELLWCEPDVYAFIYDTVDKKCLTIEGETHYTLWNRLSEDEQKEFSHDMFSDIDRVRYVDDSEGNETKDSKSASAVYNIWANNERFKEARERFICGRYWDLSNWSRYVTTKYILEHPEIGIDNYEDIFNTLVVTFWNELEQDKYIQCAEEIQKDFEKKHPKKKGFKLMGVDNNANVIKIDKTTKIDKASDEAKLQKKIAQAIHLANQKEKQEFYKAFKKNRDENNQKKYYNHTKSKTEAEWRSIKYQESMKSINDYINEKANFIVKKHVENKLGKNFEEYKKWSTDVKPWQMSDAKYKDNFKSEENKAVEYLHKIYGDWDIDAFIKMTEDFYPIYYDCLTDEQKGPCKLR